jgi:two-component system phosphate regulon sensor histidine kinase PhoR
MPTTQTEIRRLAEALRRGKNRLLDAWRDQVRQLPSAEGLDVPTLNDHIPDLIDELVTAMEANSGETVVESVLEGTPPAHGAQRLQDGFDIVEVSAEYNIMRACVHDLAERESISMQGEPFHVLNRVLDAAIGVAVAAFSEQRLREARQRREEYLAFVVHDLRTPLNAISLAISYVDRSASKPADASAEKMVWQLLRRNVRQLDELVTKVLAENVNMDEEAGFKIVQRRVDLWPLVESVRLALLPIADASGTRIENSIPPDLVAYADASMLRRIVQNLVNNAISFTAGGTVAINATLRAVDSLVEVTVSDDGEGIPPERIGLVFEKLESEPGRDGISGMGLGLAIVKAFVEAHGGEVSVTSQVGLGSTFRFTLPADPARQ